MLSNMLLFVIYKQCIEAVCDILASVSLELTNGTQTMPLRLIFAHFLLPFFVKMAESLKTAW